MPFLVGDAAIVRALGNKRGDVITVGRDGRYQLRIEGITMWCREEELTVPAKPRKRKPGRGPQRHILPGPRHARLRGGVPDTENDDEPAAPPGRVDLHGLLVEEALARVVDEIDRSLLRGADRVEVVHGKGSGRVRDAVHRQLASMPVVAAFRLDSKNAGVTWAHFR